MTSISREKLYEMVWARPMGQVAVELGVSSFKLVDICTALAGQCKQRSKLASRLSTMAS